MRLFDDYDVFSPLYKYGIIFCSFWLIPLQLFPNNAIDMTNNSTHPVLEHGEYLLPLWLTVIVLLFLP